MTQREAAIVIPARIGSLRLPGKPLLRETGQYLVQHVYERACLARLASTVLVATDSDEIFEALSAEGVSVAMTGSEHQSGTDRVHEAVNGLNRNFDVVLNLQGDEPEIEPDVIDDLIAHCDEDHPIVTCGTPITREQDFLDPSHVKVVTNGEGRALYFSRAPIPYVKKTGGTLPKDPPALLHLGLYAYTPGILSQFTSLAPSILEKTEGLEQLRALEAGIPILVREVKTAGRGVDTPEDYAAFVQRFQENLIAKNREP